MKVYDYFEIFFLRISQEKKTDKKYQKYINLFKDVFNEFDFYFSFAGRVFFEYMKTVKAAITIPKHVETMPAVM